MGLVMRQHMSFGELGDVEAALRGEGVGLAPISTGEASLISGGVTVLATATADDIANGRLKGLVVPGGANDEASLAKVRALIEVARKHDIPVLAFDDAVSLASSLSGDETEAPGVWISGGSVSPLAERADLSQALRGV